jgi:hypothetical protein
MRAKELKQCPVRKKRSLAAIRHQLAGSGGWRQERTTQRKDRLKKKEEI